MDKLSYAQESAGLNYLSILIFNIATTEVWKGISNFIPYFKMM